MRLVIQRVTSSNVSVKGKEVGRIDNGLFVLVGIGKDDSENDARYLADKLSKLRVMSDEKKKMNLSLKDMDGGILAVSQFTLFADTTKGNRPSFIKAAEPKIANFIYAKFVDYLRAYGIRVETGLFGNYMELEVKLDGPVTIILDSQEK